MKSSRLRTFDPGPNGVKPLQRLKPRTQGIESRMMTSMPQRMMILRSLRKSSRKQQMRFSNTAMTVDIEAKAMNRKNIAPQKWPSGMWLNTFGKVTNSRFGPLPGLTP